MDRRRFIRSVALGFAGVQSLSTEAQQTEKVYRVGLAHPSIPVSEMSGPEPAHFGTRAFLHALRDLGYVEGRNLILERRSADGRVERYGDIVAELVDLKADVIVTSTTQMNRAAKAATTTIPIVMVTGADPVGDGIVQSLARPGGNITGLTAAVGPDIEAKRLGLLKELVPGASRVAYLASKENKDWDRPYGRSVRLAAQALGVTLVPAEAPAQQFTDAFTLITGARVDALFVSWNAPASDWALIVDFAIRARLPSTFYYRESAELGGLMSYGLNGTDNWRRAAGYVDKILKGAKPADLPIGQPTKFELVINLNTAKALGLTIPQSLLLRADEVVQ
jgi:putative ABC transport system substrate-binding protein